MCGLRLRASHRFGRRAKSHSAPNERDLGCKYEPIGSGVLPHWGTQRSHRVVVSGTHQHHVATHHYRQTEGLMTKRTFNERCLSAIEFYQGARSGRPSPCRFSPSCSSFAHEAFALHGTTRGFWLTAKRLLRCRPFGPSGFDPVPEVHTSHTHELLGK